MFFSKRILIQFADDYITLGRTNAQPLLAPYAVLHTKVSTSNRLFFFKNQKSTFNTYCNKYVFCWFYLHVNE